MGAKRSAIDRLEHLAAVVQAELRAAIVELEAAVANQETAATEQQGFARKMVGEDEQG